MSVRRKAPNVVALTDLGPRIQRERGDILVSNAETDPDNPNRSIRRAKRQWAPDILLSKGTITLQQWQACNRYVLAYEVGICGARERSDIYVDRSGSPAGPGDVQLMAATDYRLATQAIGQSLSAVMVACVLGYVSMARWAADHAWNPNHITGWLVAGIARLADHYDA